MKDCLFCYPESEPTQNIIISNEFCMFLQLDQAKQEGIQLEGAGVIVPRKHRETPFDLTVEEWTATYTLLQDVKKYLDEK